MEDDGRYPSEDEEDGEGGLGRRTSEDSAFSFEHVEICPLEAQCNPALDGKFDKVWMVVQWFFGFFFFFLLFPGGVERERARSRCSHHHR